MIIHYHNQNFYRYIDNCKKVIDSHGYINLNDSKDTQISKLKNLVEIKYVNSIHKVEFYLRYLTDPSYCNNYYDSFIEQPDKFKFEKLKNLFIKDKL